MTAMSKALLRECKGNTEAPIYRDARGGLTFYSGCMLAARDGTDLIEPASTRTDLRVLGMLGGHQAHTVTTSRDRQFQIERCKEGIGPFANSAGGDLITASDIDTLCWVVDDQTVAKTDGTGTRSPAGYVRYVDDAGGIWIDFTKADELATMRVNGVIP